MRRIAIPGFFVATVLAFLLPLLIPAQSHSGLPVKIVAGPPPQLVVADGRIQLSTLIACPPRARYAHSP